MIVKVIQGNNNNFIIYDNIGKITVNSKDFEAYRSFQDDIEGIKVYSSEHGQQDHDFTTILMVCRDGYTRALETNTSIFILNDMGEVIDQIGKAKTITHNDPKINDPKTDISSSLKSCPLRVCWDKGEGPACYEIKHKFNQDTGRVKIIENSREELDELDRELDQWQKTGQGLEFSCDSCKAMDPNYKNVFLCAIEGYCPALETDDDEKCFLLMQRREEHRLKEDSFPTNQNPIDTLSDFAENFIAPLVSAMKEEDRKRNCKSGHVECSGPKCCEEGEHSDG